MTFGQDFLDHLGGAVTTACHCWRVTRRDGVVLGFTDHDGPLTVDGQSFEPQTGFAAREARQTLGLAPDATDIEGALASDRISAADIAAGRYDGARVETLLVNWRDTTQHALLRTATVGRITRRGDGFSVELESLAAALEQPRGRIFSRTCDAELGDGRCGVALDAPAFAGGGAVVAVRGADTLEVAGLAAFAEGWFANGLVSWASGAMAGLTSRVATHRAGAVATLVLRAPPGVAAGDTFDIVAGCDKRFATCRAKFANGLNFRGFPHLPGNDAAYAYVSEGVAFDGGALVP